MVYNIFFISSGHIYPLSDLDEQGEGMEHEFETMDQAQSCFHGWVAMGLVNYPKVTFIILPVIK